MPRRILRYDRTFASSYFKIRLAVLWSGCCILFVKWQAAGKVGMEDVRGAAESEGIVATGGDRSDVGRDC